MTRTVLIVGAGPAGLTAAYELLCAAADLRIVVVEAGVQVGGLARTERHNGNRIDIGGHRFFSKVDWVMDWWRDVLPAPAAMQQFRPTGDASANLARADALARDAPERSLLVRPRLSRILHLRKFFDYPISLNLTTIGNLGPVRIARVGASYVRARLAPIRPERNLEDFLVNRFGAYLYRMFFKDYTEKVWGVECSKISPEWGAQRIKGLSIGKALLHAVRSKVGRGAADIAQKGVETSLIERFMYPKLGPGQMWEAVAERVVERGGEIRMRTRLVALQMTDGLVTAAVCEDGATGARSTIACDAVISSMPLKDLARAVEPPPPADVRAVAEGLAYRDFITVGALLAKVKPSALVRHGFANNMYPDTWIYVQEPDVSVGRLQIFNNWSPAMVDDPARIWVGLEYFCNEGDALWQLTADQMGRLATRRAGQARPCRRRRHSRHDRHQGGEGVPGLLRQLPGVGRSPRVAGPRAEPISGGAQRHAPIQQPGPFDGQRAARRPVHRRSVTRQSGDLERQRRAGVSRGRRGQAADLASRSGSDLPGCRTRALTVRAKAANTAQCAKQHARTARGSRPARNSPAPPPPSAQAPARGCRRSAARRTVVPGSSRTGRRNWRDRMRRPT